MNEPEEAETQTSEASLMSKLPPRLLRTVSSDSNLQTISLGTASENDSLATISLAEIGGIPQSSGAMTPIDPNLIGLSPRTLNNMMGTSFQFLTQTNSSPDLSAGCADLAPSSLANLPTSSLADLPHSSVAVLALSSSSEGDLDLPTRSSVDSVTCTTSLTNTHPVSTCLNSYAPGSISVVANGKTLPAIPLSSNSSDSSVPGLLSCSVITSPPPIVTTISCLQPNAEATTSALESLPRTSSENDSREIKLLGTDISTQPQTSDVCNDVEPQEPQGSSMPVQFLSEVHPCSSQEVIGLPSPTTDSASKVDTILNLSTNAVGALSGDVESQIHPISPEAPQGQSSSLGTSGNGLQYVSITVPNVVINSSGQLVISHVSLLQAPQSSNFIPLVTQSIAAPVISQAAVPDSTSEGTKPKKTKRKGGWPKGKKRKFTCEIPQTPTTSYMIYFKENRERFQRENPTLSFKALLKLIGSAWSNLTEDEKQVYTKKAAKLKKQYLTEVKSQSQTDAYQTLVRKEAVKKIRNNEGDFPGSDDLLFMTDYSLMEEDPLCPNELYCKVCDQYFNTIHNKREHLSGRIHIKTVREKMQTYCEPDPTSDEADSQEETSARSDQTDIGDIRLEIMEKHAQRELEIRSLKEDAMDSVMKNIQLNKELNDLEETSNKLQNDLKNLKTIESSLQAKLNGLRILMTLFGVVGVGLHFN